MEAGTKEGTQVPKAQISITQFDENSKRNDDRERDGDEGARGTKRKEGRKGQHVPVKRRLSLLASHSAAEQAIQTNMLHLRISQGTSNRKRVAGSEEPICTRTAEIGVSGEAYSSLLGQPA